MEKALAEIMEKAVKIPFLTRHRLEAMLADVLWGRKAERTAVMKFFEDGWAQKVLSLEAIAGQVSSPECGELLRYLNGGSAPDAAGDQAARQAACAWLRARAGDKAAACAENLRFIADLYAEQESKPALSTIPGRPKAAGADGNAAAEKRGSPVGTLRKTLRFGHWRGEDLTWHVIDVRVGRAMLLLARDQLDWMPYHHKSESVTWETCSLRKWLNEEFYQKAFSAAEKELILQVTIPADENPMEFTDPGRDTEDRVFLLSVQEFRMLLKEETLRVFSSPKVKEGVVWWLRSPGFKPDYAAYVYYDGSLCSSGDNVVDDVSAVRPALWIHPES